MQSTFAFWHVAIKSRAGHFDDRGCMKYFHRLLNDRWVIESVYPGLRSGYFVDAGAGNGQGESATYVLEMEFGWNGICVEPVDQFYQALTQMRHCRTDNRCLWNMTGELIPFTHVIGAVPRSGITQVNKNLKEKTWLSAAQPPVQKQTVTLQDLLAQHGAPPIIHYVCLDIEGAERAVLDAFDLRAGPYRLLAVSVEGEECDDLMRRTGYVRAVNVFTDKLHEHYFLHPELACARPSLVMN
jgi:FkbM family methyltransferase